MTLTTLAHWCKDKASIKPVLESIQITMNDPTYAQKLALATAGPTGYSRPTSPANDFAHQPHYRPAMQPNFSPTPNSAMGGGGGTLYRPPQQNQQTQQTSEDLQKKKNSDEQSQN
jgi:hypothetical protein